MFAVLLTFLVN